MSWMVYGANGYTGRLIAELAVQRGHRPVLAGRSAEKIAPLAGRLGLEHRRAGLDDRAELDRILADVDVVAHCAGPFSATSAPMVEACLRTGTHYLDITGEVDVFEAVFGRDAAAREAGAVLLPGAGFDVVPTDGLAGLVSAALPNATGLDLAFAAGGGISGGTLKSALEGASGGGRVRVDGELRTVALGQHVREVDLPGGRRSAVALPWGDLATAYRSTGIPNITTYIAVPGARFAGTGQKVLGSLLALPAVQRGGRALIDRFVSGPGERARQSSRVAVFAEARDAGGRTATATLTGPNTYDFTADSVVRAAERLAAGGVPAGAHTPTTAFGANFLRELEGVRVVEPTA